MLALETHRKSFTYWLKFPTSIVIIINGKYFVETTQRNIGKR